MQMRNGPLIQTSLLWAYLWNHKAYCYCCLLAAMLYPSRLKASDTICSGGGLMGEEAGDLRPSPESAAGDNELIPDGGSSWPPVNYSVAPYRTYHFFQQFRTASSNPNNFLKGVKWYFNFRNTLCILS